MAYSPGWSPTFWVAEDDPVLILLPLALKYWGCKHESLHPSLHSFRCKGQFPLSIIETANDIVTDSINTLPPLIPEKEEV